MVQNHIFKVTGNLKISIHVICSQAFIVSSTLFDKRYIRVPNGITSSKTEDELIFKTRCQKGIAFTKFIYQATRWLRLAERPFRKKIFLKGLGYKANLSENKEILSLKIGVSHSTTVFIPSNKINLKINKKTITIKGSFPTEVGNFAEQIRRLRIPDPYKGKGIWYKNEVRVLKVLKKK